MTPLRELFPCKGRRGCFHLYLTTGLMDILQHDTVDVEVEMQDIVKCDFENSHTDE